MNPGTDMSTNDKTSPNRPAGGKHIVSPIMNFYPAMCLALKKVDS